MKNLSYADSYLYVCHLFKELSKDKDTRDCRDTSFEEEELKRRYK